MVAPAKTVSSLANGARHLSKRLIASYIVDWILIVLTAVIGGVFNFIQGARHAFSLQDPNISFPYHKDTVSVAVLIVISVIVPAAITAVISLLLIPGPTANKSTPKALVWRRKLWEWNTAWMGLGVALAGSFMITEGLKDLSGKPRPHLLALCDPDLSAASIARWQVGGLGKSVNSAVPVMVDWHICRTSDSDTLHNVFASWPSGHSSFIWSGMLYLTFFLSAKFAIQIPFLAPSAFGNRYISTFDEEEEVSQRTHNTTSTANRASRSTPPRNEAAAPPVYLLIIAFFPIGVAFFVALSRWFDYQHHGFDIICGSLIGIFNAWFGFRWYHLPIRQGAGWSWGARSRERAFWLGVGIPTYVGDEGWESKKIAPQQQTGDVESGTAVTDGGLDDRPEQTVVNGGNPGTASGVVGTKGNHRSEDPASWKRSEDTIQT